MPGLIGEELESPQPLGFIFNSNSIGDMMQISEKECSELWFRKINLQDYRCARRWERPVRSLLQLVFILLKYILFIQFSLLSSPPTIWQRAQRLVSIW